MVNDTNHKGKAEDQEESLSTILNADQRSDLTLLIADTTTAMRETILSSFDAGASLAFDPNDALLSEDDKIRNPKLDIATTDVEQFDRERKLKEQREKELSASKILELKAASLRFFEEWREGVLQRIGEVVNSKETASAQLMDASTAQAQAKPHQPADKKIDKQTKSARAAGAGEISTVTALDDLYPPVSTPLASLEVSHRILILHSMLLLLLSLEHYIAPSRVLLLYLTSSLQLPLSVLTNDEEQVAHGLLEATKELSGTSETQKKATENQSSRKWKVGLASVAGAAIIGVTGGLAAPLVAAGVGSVMGGLGLGATAAAGYLGTVAGSTVIVGGLFGAYGGRMTGQMMDNYAREVEDFAFLPVRGARKRFEGKEEEAARESRHRRLRVTIGISGWLTEKEEVVTPWRVVGKGAEVFALRYELEALMNLGNSMMAMVSSTAWGYAKSEIIKRTIFADMMGALWPLGLLKISRVVDNPFSIAKSRAEKAGEVLADALINKAQGERPVTLIGYSLGARVIYSCLTSLAKRGGFGLVESAVLIGAPTPSTTAEWRVMRTVVSGRLVNVYSENDYVLGFLYRTSSIQLGIAGLQKVEGLPSVENVDVSTMVSGHLRYRYLVGSILNKIGFEDIELGELEKEEEALKLLEEEETKKARLVKQGKATEGTGGADEADQEADSMEKQVEEKTKKSLLQRATEQLYISKGTGTGKDGGTDQKSYYQRATDQLHFSNKKDDSGSAQDKTPVSRGQHGAQAGISETSGPKSYMQLATEKMKLG
ncbi:hypothetical protein MMC26_002828 [Xylographa opegraphella]|nr:hypothetical protein [Xylographa opegraphella]